MIEETRFLSSLFSGIHESTSPIFSLGSSCEKNYPAFVGRDVCFWNNFFFVFSSRKWNKRNFYDFIWKWYYLYNGIFVLELIFNTDFFLYSRINFNDFCAFYFWGLLGRVVDGGDRRGYWGGIWVFLCSVLRTRVYINPFS